jgi:hypothetical protein
MRAKRTPVRDSVWRDRLEEFSDCLLVGLLVALASLPLITAGPAFAAGCRAIQRNRDGISLPLWPAFTADFRALLRGGIPFTGVTLGAGFLVAIDLALVVPGHAVVRPVLWLLATLATVIVLRTCELVDTRWWPTLKAAAQRTIAEPGSSALIAGAVLASVVLVEMQPLLVFLVAGPLTLAVVAVGRRR